MCSSGSGYVSGSEGEDAGCACSDADCVCCYWGLWCVVSFVGGVA